MKRKLLIGILLLVCFWHFNVNASETNNDGNSSDPIVEEKEIAEINEDKNEPAAEPSTQVVAVPQEEEKEPDVFLEEKEEIVTSDNSHEEEKIEEKNIDENYDTKETTGEINNPEEENSNLETEDSTGETDSTIEETIINNDEPTSETDNAIEETIINNDEPTNENDNIIEETIVSNDEPTSDDSNAEVTENNDEQINVEDSSDEIVEDGESEEESVKQEEPYKVIFTHEVLSYSISGGNSILLSRLFNQLNINVELSNIYLPSITNDEILSITLQSDGDYLLKSLKSFDTEELLKIYTKNGEEYIIKVTDPVGPDPVHDKEIVDNHNGTYTLSLTVKGESQNVINATKANVVVVVDISGSMDYVVNNAGMTQATGTTIGRFAEDATRLYYKYGNTYYYEGTGPESTVRHDTVYYGSGMSSDGSPEMTVYNAQNYPRYGGRRYNYTDNSTRWDQTKTAIQSLATTLLNQNNNTNNVTDLIELSFMTFATYTKYIVPTSQSADGWISGSSTTAVTNALNTVVNDGATNWDLALYNANGLASAKTDGDKTYIIFFSDGNPTAHSGTTTSATSHTHDSTNIDTGTGGANTDPGDINAAYYEVTQIHNNGYEFYGIFAYGPNNGRDYMKNLTSYGNHGDANHVSDEDGVHYFSANNQTEITNAFNSIAAAIANRVGIGSVEITDPTTSNVSTSTGVSHLLTVDTKSFKYYRNNQPWEITDDQSSLRAYLNADGEVIWDLSSLGVLENGVTYKVTFDVWPSQETLDLIADLKNGTIEYSSLDANIRKYLIEDPENPGEYQLKTNKTAILRFTDTRPGYSGTGEVEYKNPDPAETTATKLFTVAKEWYNDLDPDEEDQPPIKLTIKKGNEEWYDFTLGEYVLDENGEQVYDDDDKPVRGAWSKEVYIAIGIMVVDQSNNVSIKEVGNDYSFVENMTSGDDNWEFNSDTVHPMLINGILKMLYLTTKPSDFTANSQVDAEYFSRDGKDYYRIGNKYYYVGSNDATASITTTNYRRAVINIGKQVDYAEGFTHFDDELFEFEVTITVPEGTEDPEHRDVWFSVKVANDKDAEFAYIGDVEEITGATVEIKTLKPIDDILPASSIVYDETTGLITYIYDGEEFTVVATGEKDGDYYTYYTGYYYTRTGSLFKVKMKAGWNLRIINALVGTVYNVKEINLNEKFEFKEINVETDPVISGGYTATIDSDKYNVNGTVVKANENYNVTFVNKNVSTEITVTKIWDDSKNEYETRPNDIPIHLTYGTGEDVHEATKPTKIDNGDGTWTYVYKDLEVYDEDGNKITYTLTEDEIAKYDSSNPQYDAQKGYTITNTLKKTSVVVTKQWVDDGKTTHPTVTITLTGSNGISKTCTITSDKTSCTFEDLPMYGSESDPITYRVSEGTVTGYVGSNPVLTGTNTWKITNTQSTSVKVTKKWNDGNVTTDRKDVEITVTGSDNSSHTCTISTSQTFCEVTNLPMYKADGTAIEYNVSEGAVQGYIGSDPVSTGTNTWEITNTKLVNVVVTKVWDDGTYTSNRTEITLNLTSSYAGAITQPTTHTTNDAGNWVYKYENLLGYNPNGDKITFTLTENQVAGYQKPDVKQDSDYAFTVTNKLAVTSIKVNKTWSDNDDQDGIRPTNATVQLYKSVDGGTAAPVNTAVTVPTTNGEITTWSGLPTHEGGKEIEYSVEETLPSDSGYISDVTGTAPEFTIINTHTPEKVSVTVTKTWNDGNATNRPTPKFVLSIDGTKSDKVPTVNGNVYTFANLERYRDGGTEIQYTVVEEALSGYQSGEMTQDANNKYAFTITNTKTTSVKVTKKWNDGNVTTDRKDIEITVTGSDNSSHTCTISTSQTFCEVTNLPMYKADGTAIEYNVSEGTVQGYIGSDPVSTGTNTWEITNTKATSVKVVKVWEGDPTQDGKEQPDSIQVQLYKTIGDETSEEGDAVKLGENEPTGWSYTWEELPGYSENVEIIYSVKEVTGGLIADPEDGEVEGKYNYTVKVENDGSFKITNKFINETTTVTVTKVWDDNDNEAEKRPASIVLQLLADGDKVDGKTVTLTDDRLSDSISDLPKYNNGTEIKYTWEEKTKELPDGYYQVNNVTEGTNTTITNKYETIEIYVDKYWEDDENIEEVRPESIRINVLLKGNVVAYRDIQALTYYDEDDQPFEKWYCTFRDLPKYIGGEEVQYEVEEVLDDVSAKLYTPSYVIETGETEISVEITNTHEVEYTEIVVNKLWDDDGDTSKRTPSVTIKLVDNNGKEYGTIVLSDENLWTDKFTDLPVNYKGKEIVYSVEEIDVPEGYTAAYEENKLGFTVHNILGAGDGEPDPPHNNPQTGDNIVLYLIALLVSIVGLVSGKLYLKENN